MKHLLMLLFGICLLFSSIPTMADQAADEAAIRKAMDKLIATYNSHDAKSMLLLLDENNVPWEGGEEGNAAQEKRLTETFNSQKNMKVKLTQEIGIVSVSPDVAIYKANVDIMGMVNDEGQSQPTMKNLGAWILKKKGGKWLLASYFGRPVQE